MATKSTPNLTLSGAQTALAAAEAHSKHIGVPMNVAIVDSSCHLLAFHRMEGAKPTSINIAIDKAFTAAGHRAPTSIYKENVWPGGPAFGIWNSNGGRFMTIAGGVPILDTEGRVLGAIGCSTGTPAQDEEVAKAGKEAVEKVFREEKKQGRSRL
ncbi:glc operon protein GlcG [Zopfia rhizophila CBS 207.26]|uniref:Glc operon protein GlcG n=1 Tax=Zopfia rhizophila CBS 207.26 TaxID=1314779 RepID=A0A6A6ESY0_9PEZI|nr:glc operon protein GlcG [Zopfia rhizophila CBS 207.26]